MVMKPPPLTEDVPPPAATEYTGCSPKVRTFAPIAEEGDVAGVALVVGAPDPPAPVGAAPRMPRREEEPAAWNPRWPAADGLAVKPEWIERVAKAEVFGDPEGA